MDKKGLRLTSRYPKYLAAYGAWFAVGMGLGFIALKSWFWATILILAGAFAIALAVEGSRMTERVYSRFDLAIQWITLALPIIFLAILTVLLFTRFLRPYLGPALLYLAGLVIIAALAGRELRRGIPVV